MSKIYAPRTVPSKKKNYIVTAPPKDITKGGLITPAGKTTGSKGNKTVG